MEGNIAQRHIVGMPYPGRGHINPMMNLCTLLASRHSLLVSVVVTEEWLGLVDSDPEAPSNFQLMSIPNVIPSELNRGSDYDNFVEAVYTKMEGPFEQLLQQLEPPASCIIADTALSWAVAVGNRRKIPVASFWIMSPSTFSIHYHCDLIAANGHSGVHDIQVKRGDENIDYIPGITSFRLKELPSYIAKGGKVLKRVLEAFSWVTKAQCLLFSSVYELESHAIDILRAKLSLPIYPIGPSIPYMALQNLPTEPVHMNYFNWLDSQSKCSVLYVSLGSYLPISKTQIDEIAKGLQASGVRFLWAACRDEKCVSEMSGDMGLMVPWCDQLKVLCHGAIGGFLTHCGWNSTLEGIYSGVPMLTFPLLIEQPVNSKFIVEDWKIGIRLKGEFGEGNVVKREEIACTVKRLMDLDGDESKEMRRRVREMQDACRRAVGKGGSSCTSLDAFVRDVVKGHGPSVHDGDVV